MVKSTGANSGLKLYIIQNVDRKLALDDISKAKGLSMDDLLKEMEQIVYSGTKLNISYWIDEILDDDQQEEIFDYFMESESESDDKSEGFDTQIDFEDSDDSDDSQESDDEFNGWLKRMEKLLNL